MGMCICTHLGLEVKENGHGKVGVGRGHVRLRRAPEVRRAYVRLVGLQHRRDVPRNAAMNPSSAAIPAAEVAQISGSSKGQREDQTGMWRALATGAREPSVLAAKRLDPQPAADGSFI